MTLPESIQNHKTLGIALIVIAQAVAQQLGSPRGVPISHLCDAHGVCRPYVYRVSQRILDEIVPLADARPGRPPSSEKPSTCGSTNDHQLTVDVLRYRLDHPGALVDHASKASYSPAFRRFVLGLLDGYDNTVERFAAAVEIPLDTVKDWIAADREGRLTVPPPMQRVLVPEDASELCRAVAEHYERWQGGIRDFIRDTCRRFELSGPTVTRLLKALGVISSRKAQPPRYRGSTGAVSPGRVLVTDGKIIDVVLTSSGQRQTRVWQAMADQTTACDMSAVVTQNECAEGVDRAFNASLAVLGKAPAALVYDNKPCNTDSALIDGITAFGTQPIAATPNRPQNKAVVEGKFGLFEQQIGSIVLDDTNKRTLITSAVSEVVRTFTAVNNHVPRGVFGGKSRMQVVREHCPDPGQAERDRAFLRRLAHDHDLPRRRKEGDPLRRHLLDEIFRRLGIEDKDPKGSLRRFLARFECATLRQAAAIVKAKLDQDSLDCRYVHRYLTKIVIAVQEECDLERMGDELLHLCQHEGRGWIAADEEEYDSLCACLPQSQLLLRLAEHAAHGGLPVQYAYWRQRLIEHLRRDPDSMDEIKRYLTRLYEAPAQRRRLLLSDIIELQTGLL